MFLIERIDMGRAFQSLAPEKDIDVLTRSIRGHGTTSSFRRPAYGLVVRGNSSVICNGVLVSVTFLMNTALFINR